YIEAFYYLKRLTNYDIPHLLYLNAYVRQKIGLYDEYTDKLFEDFLNEGKPTKEHYLTAFHYFWKTRGRSEYLLQLSERINRDCYSKLTPNDYVQLSALELEASRELEASHLLKLALNK